MLFLQDLPFDLLTYIACFGGSLDVWREIFALNEMNVLFIAIARIQKKWRESKIANLIPGTRILLKSKEDLSEEECVIVSKSRDRFRKIILCVQVKKSYFKFFKYIQFEYDRNYDIIMIN
jgi:hypothetical protein